MRLRTVVLVVMAVLTAFGVLRAQRPFQEYRGIEYNDFPLPDDWNEKAEFTRARLKCPGIYIHGAGDGGPLNWTIDYPRSDRHLLQGIRRLTRIDTRSVEQVVEMDGSDESYNWPFLYAVEPGHWDLPDNQASRLRDYLLRGGFLMVDDFHGTLEWNNFKHNIEKVFPERKIVDLDNKNPIFHVIYDLDDRFQVPGWQWSISGLTYEYDGFDPKWRAILDDDGRVMVAICHNMDLGDAWEWSDDPRYPEKWASLAYRIATNYVMYDMTH